IESDQDVGTRGCGMKFRVERDVLADAVTWTARTLPTRPPAPVLAGVRLEADASGTIGLSSFDYEVSARSEIPAEVSEPGTVLVSGRLLAEISRALPAKPVDVVPESSGIAGRAGYSSTGMVRSVKRLAPHVTMTLLPSRTTSTGFAGSAREISARSRPDTSTVPGSLTSAGISERAETS